MDNGFNPIRWNCDEKGCFNKKKRPKIEMFSGVFSGNIGMTDVDATVEEFGRFLFIEFKSHQGIGVGQSVYFERLTKLSDKITVMLVEANAETMEVFSFCTIRHGIRSEWQACDMEQFIGVLKAERNRWIAEHRAEYMRKGAEVSP